MPTNPDHRKQEAAEKKTEERKGSGRGPGTAFEVEMFPSDVDSVSHPYADQLRDMLTDVAREYDCRLLSFDVHKGIVSFSFDCDELNADILRIIQGEDNR